MDRKRKTFTLKSSTEKDSAKTKASSRRTRGDCDVSESTSHTQFFRIPRHEEEHKRITTDEYFGVSETMSGSSDTFRCIHGPDGKQYTEKGLLKRNFLKELDPIPTDSKWTDKCPPGYGWGMAEKLAFLVMDPTVFQQKERLEMHLRDFAKTTARGYRVDVLDNVCLVMDFLIESLPKNPDLYNHVALLLQNMNQPILLCVVSDVVKYFENIRNYIGFMGYLLMRLEDDHLFSLVSDAMIWQLAVPDTLRGPGSAHLRHTLAAAAPVLYQTISRMLAVTTAVRFPTFLTLALLLACDGVENCIELMKENIIENIFYRFNPYFPDRKLPVYDVNPADPQDYNVKLGASSVNMCTTLSLLLVLLKTTKQYLDENPEYRLLLPCPDTYGLRCFVWAYRYECRARDHQRERITLTVVIMALLHCFRDRLMAFSTLLMPDVMTLSVLSEVPPRGDWTSGVNFNTSQQDVQLKKLLIHLSVDLLKVFPYNKCMVESRHWLLGLMYLIDPGLCYLRGRWSPSLFAELRKTTFQALVCALPLTSPKLVKEYGLVRRIMWYIEWYSESPYELPILYWCLRLLQVATYHRGEPTRDTTLKDLYDTHGVIILIHLCYTLLQQKVPPVEKSQAILALALRLLTSAVEPATRLTCCVYPEIKWPQAVTALAAKMLDVALYSLEKHYIVSDRWLISLLNFIWEAIIWKSEYREKYIVNGGIYKLLDIITMSRAPVQCIAMALICDATRAGDAVGQLVTWRANLGASNAHPCLVKRGATIATLLAAIFRDECKATGVRLDHNGVIMDLESPIMSSELRKEMSKSEFCTQTSQRTPVCLIAADISGSRMSKAFAILHMLSEDLNYKVSLANEAYNLYKNIQLTPEDEAVLVLCSYYLTLKQSEVWVETRLQSPGLLPEDQETLEEFLLIGRGWAKEIKQLQDDVLEKDRAKECSEESSLYAFVGRARLLVALDALRRVRCEARSADRARITHALLQDAVRAHHRRSVFAKRLGAPVLRTYGPTLDGHNITGQNVKVYSIHPKDKPKPREDVPS